MPANLTSCHPTRTLQMSMQSKYLKETGLNY
jgi:hypothetical protein